jgi:hypothetical protein
MDRLQNWALIWIPCSNAVHNYQEKFMKSFIAKIYWALSTQMEQENTYSWHQQPMSIVQRQIVTAFIFSLLLQSTALNGEYEWMKKIWVLWLLKITDWRYVWGSIATVCHLQQTNGLESNWGVYQRDLAACPGGERNAMAPKWSSHDWNECSSRHGIRAACRRCIAFQ